LPPAFVDKLPPARAPKPAPKPEKPKQAGLF